MSIQNLTRQAFEALVVIEEMRLQSSGLLQESAAGTVPSARDLAAIKALARNIRTSSVFDTMVAEARAGDGYLRHKSLLSYVGKHAGKWAKAGAWIGGVFGALIGLGAGMQSGSIAVGVVAAALAALTYGASGAMGGLQMGGLYGVYRGAKDPYSVPEKAGMLYVGTEPDEIAIRVAAAIHNVALELKKRDVLKIAGEQSPQAR